MPEVTLYRRRHCGLCDDALMLLRRLSRSHEFTIVARDIDEEPTLLARYNEVVPVIVMGDTELASAPIDPDDLRDAIEAAFRKTGG